MNTIGSNNLDNGPPAMESIHSEHLQLTGEPGHEALDNAMGRPACTVQSVPPENAKGVTAYFVFASVHREQVKAQLQAEHGQEQQITVGMVGKRMGDLWKQCSDEVKETYSSKAKQNKENSKTQEQKDASNATKPSSALIPRSTVKKIVMLDEDQKRIAGDSVELLSRAAELFLSSLAVRARDEARSSGRSTIAFKDIGHVLKRWKPTGWQGSPFSELDDFVQSKNSDQEPNRKTEPQRGRPITSFFQSAKE